MVLLFCSCNEPAKPVPGKKIKQNKVFSVLVEMPVEESNHFVQNQLRILKTWYYTDSFGKRASPARVSAMQVYRSDNTYENLSHNFNFRVLLDENSNETMFFDCRITLEIFSKKDSLIQTIRTTAVSGSYPFTDKEISHVRSYETHYNEKRKLADGYYHGQLVVGDFNFDSLVDIAVVKGFPMGSGNPTYEFYFQTQNLQFVRNTYFSDVVLKIPEQLNPKKKTFLAWDPHGCCWATFRYFKFDETGKCKLMYMKETGPEQE